MTIHQATLLLATVLFSSVSCFQQFVEEYGSAKIGERCERDRNCIKNAYCRGHMTCLCDRYYSPTADKSMCIASAGLSCTTDLTCGSMTNAECKQGVCACKDSFILDISNSSNCIRSPSKVGDRCYRNDECQDALGRALCINERCECISSYHYTNQTGQCIQTRSLYNSCTRDYECLDFYNEYVLQCRNGECVCKEGEPTCNKGSSYAIHGIPLILSIFFYTLI